MYNLTNMSGNETGLLTVMQGVNSLLGDIFGTVLMVGISLVIYISILANTGDGAKAAITTGLLGFVLSLGLVAIDLVNPLLPYIYLALAAVVAAFTWKE